LGVVDFTAAPNLDISSGDSRLSKLTVRKTFSSLEIDASSKAE
jgi:hypothetical protein